MRPSTEASAVQRLFGSNLERLRTAGYLDLALGRSLSADEIRSEVRRISRLAKAAGLRPGDALALWTEPASSFVCGYLTALHQGLVAVPLDAHQSEVELNRRGSLVGARALWAQTEDETALSWAAQAGLPVLPAETRGRRDVAPPTYPPDAAMVLFTSGSTGPSKAAVITHRGLVANALATAEWQRCTPSDVIAGNISLFHCFAILHTILAPFLAGAGVVAMAPFSPSKTIEAASQHPLSIVPGTPAMFEMLLADPRMPDAGWQALRCGCSGGSLLRPETQRRFLEITGAPLLNGYGITEATSFVASPPIDQRDQAPYSMGRPVTGVQCRVRAPTSAEGAGELEVGGPSVMACYLADPAATSEVITSDGWLRTGDKVRIAGDGELFYVGRIKNVINRGGEKIHPELIEAVLADSASMRHLVAVGVPDEVLGERIAVVVEADAGDFNEDELRCRAAESLARHERPDWYVRVDQMPRTPTGKLSLTRARQLALEYVTPAAETAERGR